jgi:hypothetical protein
VIARRAWQAIRRHESWFLEWDVAEPSPVAWLKRLGELASAIGQLRQIGASWCDPAERQKLLDRCWTALDAGDRLRFAIGLANDTLPLATIYPPFHAAGYRAPELEAVLAAVSARWSPPSPEIGLMVGLALRAVGITPPWDLEHLLARAWIASEQVPEAVRTDPRVAYAVTHTVFFLRDHAPEWLDRIRSIEPEVPGWIEHYLARGDVDLVGELVLTQRAMGTRSTSREIIQLFENAGEPDGLVRPYVGRPMVLGSRIAVAYHATLVAMLAASDTNSS